MAIPASVRIGSDLEKLAQILDNQTPGDEYDWPRVRYEITQPQPGDHDYEAGNRVYLTIKSESVGFAFDARGQFVGLFNWKG